MQLAPLAPNRGVLLGVAVLCFANLLLEVVLTRIFSAVMFYHFTFLAIALALFGMGASGVYIYVRSERYTSDRALADLVQNANRFAATTVLAVIYVLANPINLGIGSSQTFQFTSQTFFQLVFLNAITATPFFFAGMVVSLSILHFREHISQVYFYDLFGAALAALVASVLLGMLGAPSTILLVAVLGAMAGTLFVRPKGWGWAPVVLTAALLVFNLVVPIVQVASGKGTKNQRVVFEKWNAFSRITVEKLKNNAHDIKIDASAATRIHSAATIDTRKWYREVTAFAYSLHQGGPAHALIIGPGGGMDVANALAAGADKVTGVEVNPIIAEDVMKGAFSDVSQGLYSDPRVRVWVDEGRSFIRRSSDRYQVIQATLVDTWAATASGAFALTENMLYTVDAFEDYFHHVTDDGVVTMTRWHLNPEASRLMLLAAAGLVRIGVPETETRKHLFYVTKAALGTLVAKRTPFTSEEITRLNSAAKRGGFKIILSPETAGTSVYEKLIDAGPYSRLVASQPDDLSPPTDDRPFFFYYVKPADLFKLNKHKRSGLQSPVVWIIIAFGVSLVVLAGVFILLPLFIYRRTDLTGGDPRQFRRRLVALCYFAALGFGFIIIEIGLMQKLGLFLGHPVYGLLVVLFSILIATSLGARISGRIPDDRGVTFAAATAIGITLLSFAYAGTLSGLLRDWIVWSLSARIALSVLLVFLVGLLMGMMVPLGVRKIGAQDARIIPWGWGVNGATSVIGTVMATILAIHLGFNATLFVGAAMYIGASVSIYMFGRMSASIAKSAEEAKDTTEVAGDGDADTDAEGADDGADDDAEGEEPDRG